MFTDASNAVSVVGGQFCLEFGKFVSYIVILSSDKISLQISFQQWNSLVYGEVEPSFTNKPVGNILLVYLSKK